jgi:phosphate transport system protein
MPDRQHTSKHYEQQLRELKDKLLLMSHQAELMISDSIRSLVDRRPTLAEEVIRRDDDLDKLEIAIDNLCYEVLALEQPVARDLRFIATALKIVRDLERIGDIAVNIAERSLELIQEPELKRLVDLPIMADAAQKILKESLDAFVNSDADLAEKVILNDNVVDDLYEQIFRELLTYMLEDPRSISRAIKLIFIAKHLERVGDHSANIAEMVVFLVKGQDIRHGTRLDRRR